MLCYNLYMIKILNVQSLYSALYKAVDYCNENKSEEIEIIVPDKLSLFMEKFLFEHMGITASFNIKVSTLNRFAKKTVVVDKDKQISKVGSILLVHKILNDNCGNLKVLKSKLYSFSYAEDIFKTISQLKASKIGFEEMKKFVSLDEQLNDKIADLALVYEQYETLKAGLLDASDVFLMSTFFVSQGRENSKILFVGFDDFTAIEYAIIERLALVADVNVINFKSKEKNAYIYNDEVISQLKNIAYINQIPFNVVDCVIQKSAVKQFLENNLYSLQNEQFTLNNELIKVYSGKSVVDEIEFVARDIRYKVLKGQRYDDFGVAVFNLESNICKIKEIFEKYEINYYLDHEIILTGSVLFKFFVNVFKYNLEGYSLTSIIDLINSPFLRMDNDNKRKIIQRLMSLNFRGKISSQTNLNLDEDISDFINFFETITIDKKDECVAVVEKLKKLDSVLDFDSTLFDLAKEEMDAKILLTKSKNAIISLFDEILNFNKNININELFDIFKHVATVVKINNLPLSLDAVKIVDANNSMEIFNELYIVNATQENAPMLKHDCGIIVDSEINKLNFSFKLAPTISHINKLSKLRLFNSLMLFENELVVTYSNSQSEIVKELLNKIQVETCEGVMNIVPIKTFDFDKYIALSKWDYINYLCKEEKNNLKINENIIKNKEFLNISNNNLIIYENFNNISATTLENYFKCPFYSFLSNILKIKPNLKVEILSLDIGNILHEIMFKFYQRKKNVGDIYEFCKNEVFNFVEKEERLKLNFDSPIITNLIDEAVRVVNTVNYIDENSMFEPKYFEYDFKDDKALKLKNVSIIGKVDRVDVCGDMFRIVDYKSGRADANLKELYYGNKLQLFLYSCAMENVLKKSGVGSFYLPLHNAYTKELLNTYSMKGFYLAEDFVVRAFDKRLEPGMKSDIINVRLNKNNTIAKTIGYKELSADELLKLKNYSKQVSENAVDEIKSGYISPNPSDVSKPCEYCPYVHICLKECNSIDYRNSNKVDLTSFKEVSDETI